MICDYSLKKKKTVTSNHDFNFKLKIVIGDYGFNFFNKFKIIITNYSFDDTTKKQ